MSVSLFFINGQQNRFFVQWIPACAGMTGRFTCFLVHSSTHLMQVWDLCPKQQRVYNSSLLSIVHLQHPMFRKKTTRSENQWGNRLRHSRRGGNPVFKFSLDICHPIECMCLYFSLMVNRIDSLCNGFPPTRE